MNTVSGRIVRTTDVRGTRRVCDVLAAVMGKPYHVIFHEFQGGSSVPSDIEGSGDVFLLRDTGQTSLLRARQLLGSHQVDAAEKLGYRGFAATELEAGVSAGGPAFVLGGVAAVCLGEGRAETPSLPGTPMSAGRIRKPAC